MKAAADLAPIEDLDRNILTLCSRINAATYEVLAMPDLAGGKTKCPSHRCLLIFISAAANRLSIIAARGAYLPLCLRNRSGRG